MKKQITNASDLDGYDDLTAEDKEKVSTAWETGQVAPEDIPESAKKPQGEEEEEEGQTKPKAKKAKKAAAEGEDKPKRARTTKKVLFFSFVYDASCVDLVLIVESRGR
jgi:hypothetical protein